MGIPLEFLWLGHTMVNAWVEHVRAWSKANGVSYMCAVSKPECRAAYKGGKAVVAGKKMVQSELLEKYPAYSAHKEAKKSRNKKLFKELNLERLKRAQKAAEKPKVRMGKTVRVPKSKLGGEMVGILPSQIME